MSEGPLTTFSWCASLQGVEATRAVAQRLQKLFWPQAAVLLEGELGSGKTTLVRALLEAWAPGAEVSSPSFDLVHHYRVGEVEIYHVDCYRLQDPTELAALDLPGPPLRNTILLAEWGGWLRPYYPDRFEIALEFEGREGRRLRLSAWGDESTQRAVQAFSREGCHARVGD
ncbi:MAG: tRNA (adenosine(37)-N6)-threonylcarbamoyltransferase complex ATPase subunit type 1 TsaE [Firmicutes bacterium]|nr:tRNA (adenosine(37)-N6)-threonylcarbamoyltransferase complex ATPase subunit type 1 TsaE [Bacillota bacterium]